MTAHLRCGVQCRLQPLKLRLVKLGVLHPVLGRFLELYRFIVRPLAELEDVDDPLTDDRTSGDGGRGHAARGVRDSRMRVGRKEGGGRGSRDVIEVGRGRFSCFTCVRTGRSQGNDRAVLSTVWVKPVRFRWTIETYRGNHHHGDGTAPGHQRFPRIWHGFHTRLFHERQERDRGRSIDADQCNRTCPLSA